MPIQRPHPTQTSTSFFAAIEELLLRGPVAFLKREWLYRTASEGDVSVPIYGYDPVLLELATLPARLPLLLPTDSSHCQL
ncbi:hypothetical protein BDW66DRAFT_144685 [Aspergillus desertorum]